MPSAVDGLGATFPKFVLNINGHSHNYERFQPISGVTHITDGAASSVETPYCCTDSRSVFRALHLDREVFLPPYEPAQLAAIAAGSRPEGPL